MSSADLTVLHYIEESVPGTTPNNSVRATGTLTGTANPANNDTVTIGTKTYTFQTVLTNVDGNVLIGADLAATLVNLMQAINLSGGTPGVDYAEAMTEHPTAYASSVTATTLVASAKVGGTAGNAIATTEVGANTSWGAATLTGGVNTSNTAWETMRFNSESLNFNIENTQSEELRPDRTESDLIQTGASSAGDVNIELSYGSFDDMLEALLCGTWASNVVENGSTRRFFTLRKGFTDANPPQYHLHRGCMVEGLNLEMEIGRIVTGAFNFMGFGIDPEFGVMETTFGGETVNAAPTTSPMNAVTNFQDFMINAVPYSGCINKLSLNVKNNVRAIQCLGTLGARDMRLGILEVTGDAEFYFNEGSIYDKFVKGFEFDLRFALEDNVGNRLDFVLPRVKLESAEVVAGGRNTDVMMSGTYRALYDGTAGNVIQITRTPA